MNRIISELTSHGAAVVKVVDISRLSEKETRGYRLAILIGLPLIPPYIVQQSKEAQIDHTEFAANEYRGDELAEWTADYLQTLGYPAFAQSERNLLLHSSFDEATKTTPLPHKKVAMLAGLGWIGKSNLLVTPEYGSAITMCTVLTNAPLPADNRPLILSKCGECTVCKDICPPGVIHGTTWHPGTPRDCIVDVYRCKGCLKCLVHCPWTQRYGRKNYHAMLTIERFHSG